jgi:hypothetical protein
MLVNKKGIKYYCILIIVFFCMCCSHNRQQPDVRVETQAIRDEFPNSFDLKGRKIVVDDVFKLTRMIVLDDLLFISCFECDTMLFVYSLPEFKLIRNYGNKGQGPGELLYPIFLAGSSNRLNLWGFSELKKIKQFDVTNVADITLIKEFVLSYPTGYNDMHIVKDSFLIYSEFPEKLAMTKMNLYNQEDKIEYNFKENPKTGKEMFFQDNQGHLAASDKGIAYLYYYKNKIDFFDLNLSLVGTTNSKNINPSIIVDINLAGENTVYYKQFYSGKESLYVHYKGFPSKNDNLNHGACIEQYDWRGNKIAQYNLDVPIDIFVVNESQSKLYTYSQADEDCFYEFDLKK